MPSFPWLPGLNCAKVSCPPPTPELVVIPCVHSQPLRTASFSLAPNATRLLAQCEHLSRATQLRDHQWLKRLLKRITFSRSTAGTMQEERKGQCFTSCHTDVLCMWDLDYITMKYSVCRKRTAHRQSMSSSVWKPSVSQTYLCLHTHTHFLKRISEAL